LATNVPDVQFESFVHQRLDVESLRRHNVAGIFVGKFLQDGGLSGVIQTQDEDTSFLVALLELAEQREKTHFELWVQRGRKGEGREEKARWSSKMVQTCTVEEYTERDVGGDMRDAK